MKKNVLALLDSHEWSRGPREDELSRSHGDEF